MNKLKLLTAVAVVGLFGVSARAGLPPSYSSVNIHLTTTINTNETSSGSSFKFRVTKVKITNKDVLARVAAEFGDTYPAGAQLAIFFGFWNDQFSVLGKTNNVIRGNVSSGLSDSYQLDIFENGYQALTGGGNNNATTAIYTFPGEFTMSDATGANVLDVFGLTTTVDKFTNNNWPESFTLSNGVETGAINGSSCLVTGSISGHGADSNDLDF